MFTSTVLRRTALRASRISRSTVVQRTALPACGEYGGHQQQQHHHHQQQQVAFFSSGDDLPYHVVVGMPALSPTMEMGTIAEWNVKEGDSFAAGDLLCQLETDKTSIDFEAQDDGFVAKILKPNGSQDVPVGVPIMVTVEEGEYVEAFANYEAPAAKEVAPIPPAEEPNPAPVAAPPPSPTPAASTQSPSPPVVATPQPQEPPAVPVVEPPPVAVAAKVADTMGPMWGASAKVKSPIAKTLAAQQQAYVDKYGTTGQLPL